MMRELNGFILAFHFLIDIKMETNPNNQPQRALKRLACVSDWP